MQRRPASDGARRGGGPVPALVHAALRTPGQPLDAATRAEMGSRFGHDFSQVRVHTGHLAAESARAVGALAYTAGQNVIFGHGQYDPGHRAGQDLIAHELAHVLQQADAAGVPEQVGDAHDELEAEAERLARWAPRRQHVSWPQAPGLPTPCPPAAASRTATRVQRTPDDLTARADYPTVEQQRRIQEVVNPQQERVEAAHTAPPPVTDVPGLRSEMAACANRLIDEELPAARERETSAVQLGLPAIGTLADVAQREVQRFYASYLRAAVHTPAETARIAGYRLRDHLHVMPAGLPGSVDDVAKGLLANRMLFKCAQILQDHNVITGEGKRDQALFLSIRNGIFTARTADMRTLARFNPGFQSGGEVFIQSRLREFPGSTAEESEIRGRWRILGTTIHEMMHAVAHEAFRDAVAPLEEYGIAVEGFAEFFTRPVYDAVVASAASDASLRSSVEGVARPYDPSLIAERNGYPRYFQAVSQINTEILGGNTENLKVAYFMGRVEYIGLGGWNAAEAQRREVERRPAHQLGAAILLLQETGGAEGGFRFRYTHVVLGRAGNFELSLGGELGYLSPGDRLSMGGTALLQYSWPNFYISGGASLGPSVSLGEPVRNSIRLDALPGIEAGVRIGAWRVGAGTALLIPLHGGPADQRALLWAARFGLSVDL